MAKPTKQAKNAQSKADQIGTEVYSINHFVNQNVTGMCRAFAVYSCFRFRDKITQTHGINRFELWLLLSLAGFLSLEGKEIVSKDMFFDFLAGNYNHRIKFEGYYQGLLKLKCIGTYEYVSTKPGTGSVSIGLSDYGIEVIKAHFRAIYGLFDRYGNSCVEFNDFSAVTGKSRHRPIAA